VQQLGFDGMPRRLYTCTPTRLTTWLDCPRRYRMSYLDRPPPGKGPPWAHNSLGASVHNALAGWWRLPLAQRTGPAAGELLERGWIDEGFADAAQSSRYRAWARRMVEAYVTRLDPAREPVGVERTVATRTELIAVSGRIDRLDDRREPEGPGGLVVVDYKTGRRLLTVDDARTSLPLALYALAAGRVMRRPCRRVELHHLPTGQVLAWEHTDESLARQLRRAEDIAAECAAADESFRGGAPEPSAGRPPAAESGSASSASAQPASSARSASARTASARSASARSASAQSASARSASARTASAHTASAQSGSAVGLPADPVDVVFPPRPGSWCGWCDYRAHCPEGARASEPRRPWDGLGAGSADPPDDPAEAGSWGSGAGEAGPEPGPREPGAGESGAGAGPGWAGAEPGPGGPGAGEAGAREPEAERPDAHPSPRAAEDLAGRPSDAGWPPGRPSDAGWPPGRPSDAGWPPERPSDAGWPPERPSDAGWPA
jgi:putative RecB family exonuclease